MSRIYEALQKSSSRPGSSGFADITTTFRFPIEVAQPILGPEPDVRSELEQFAPLPISLGEGSRLVSLTDKESLGAEKFRFLAVRLRQMQQSKSLRKICITSTIPEEGKSTVSSNLAVMLAKKAQHKVLLIDGDLRRPSLSRIFGLGPRSGLSGYLAGETAASDFSDAPIYRLQDANLWFLPAGVPPENPLELMQSSRLADLLERVSKWFDWVIIDSPPVLPLADTSVWVRMVDGVFLVAREGTSEKRQLQRGLTALEGSRLMGVILNNSNNTDHKKYYQRYGPSAPATEPAAKSGT